MNAREKLNVAYVNGSLLVAGIIAFAFESWPVFIVGLVLVIVVHIFAGGIRPSHR